MDVALIKFSTSFNTRRYFFWAAVVEDFTGIEAHLAFKKVDKEPGEGFEISASEGDVIYYGLKDQRKNYNERYWGVVKNGCVEDINKRQARKIIAEKKQLSK